MLPFSRVSHAATSFTGSWMALALLALFSVAWVFVGAAVEWSRPWELAVTMGVPIVNLVLIVILQHAQNRNARAVHVKLNELLSALQEPDDEVIEAERRPDDELKALDDRYHQDLASRHSA